MKTFILQYRRFEWVTWKNYTADDGSNVEFIRLIHAESVARDLAAEGFQGCCRKDNWQIVSSTGEHLPVPLQPTVFA